SSFRPPGPSRFVWYYLTSYFRGSQAREGDLGLVGEGGLLDVVREDVDETEAGVRGTGVGGRVVGPPVGRRKVDPGHRDDVIHRPEGGTAGGDCEVVRERLDELLVDLVGCRDRISHGPPAPR